MQPILILLFFILLLMLLGTILLLARENKKTNDKQQIRLRNGTAIDEMPSDLDEAMVWLEAFAQKENENRKTELSEWLAGFTEQDEEIH